jgi:hypothetical protein
MAIERGSNQKIETPFSRKAKLNKFNYMGGKLDDTTIIIARV